MKTTEASGGVIRPREGTPGHDIAMESMVSATLAQAEVRRVGVERHGGDLLYHVPEYGLLKIFQESWDLVR